MTTPPATALTTLHVLYRVRVAALRERLTPESGEGVISTAIAVLIMALLGAGMWFAFQAVFDGAAQRTGTAVDSIGG